MKVLSIEDDPVVRESLSLIIQSEGHSFYSTDTGAVGISLVEKTSFDIILLDIGLPDMTGFEVIKRLREAKIATPIIVLSGHTGVPDVVQALRLGADDYLKKPFHTQELVARMNAVIRRFRGYARSVVEAGRLTIDLDSGVVCVDDQRIHLTLKEYKVLELLALKKGTIVSKTMLLDHIYGEAVKEHSDRLLEVYILRLRKKIVSVLSGSQPIQTVRGQGYVLTDSAAPPETPTEP